MMSTKIMFCLMALTQCYAASDASKHTINLAAYLNGDNPCEVRLHDNKGNLCRSPNGSPKPCKCPQLTDLQVSVGHNEINIGICSFNVAEKKLVEKGVRDGTQEFLVEDRVTKKYLSIRMGKDKTMLYVFKALYVLAQDGIYDGGRVKVNGNYKGIFKKNAFFKCETLDGYGKYIITPKCKKEKQKQVLKVGTEALHKDRIVNVVKIDGDEVYVVDVQDSEGVEQKVLRSELELVETASKHCITPQALKLFNNGRLFICANNTNYGFVDIIKFGKKSEILTTVIDGIHRGGKHGESSLSIPTKMKITQDLEKKFAKKWSTYMEQIPEMVREPVKFVGDEKKNYINAFGIGRKGFNPNAARGREEIQGNTFTDGIGNSTNGQEIAFMGFPAEVTNECTTNKGKLQKGDRVVVKTVITKYTKRVLIETNGGRHKVSLEVFDKCFRNISSR